MKKKIYAILTIGIAITFLLPIVEANIQTTKIKELKTENISPQNITGLCFFIGRIDDLNTEYEYVDFVATNLWVFGYSLSDDTKECYIMHIESQDYRVGFSKEDYKGILTYRFIFGLLNYPYIPQPPVPVIIFVQKDMSEINTLTVVSADPANILWSDIGLKVDGVTEDHGMSGDVEAGHVIDITAIAGTGAYTISISYIPTNTLIGSFEFTAGS